MTLRNNIPAEVSARAWVLAGLLLPVNKSLAVIAMLIIGLFAWTGPAINSNLRNLRSNYLLWLPPLYFIWHLVTLAWSDNKVYGGHDLETKLSFLLIPVLIGATQPGLRQRLNFFIALTVGVMMNGLWSLFNAFQAFEQDGLTSHFFYIELSKITHVAYLTMMVNMCVLYLIYELFYSRKSDPQPWSLITALLLLSLFSVLLDSRTAFFTLLITSLGYYVITAIKHNEFRKHFTGFILFLVLFGGGYYALSRVHNRMAELGNVVRTINEGAKSEAEGQEADYGNAGVRPILWKNALEIISKNPLGVGCGDLKDDLQKQYESSGFYTGVKFRLNPHNQYFHTGVGTGLPGIILLLLMLFLPLWQAFKMKKGFTFACLSVIVLNGITESVLEVQNGIMLFTILYALLVSDLKDAKFRE